MSDSNTPLTDIPMLTDGGFSMNRVALDDGGRIFEIRKGEQVLLRYADIVLAHDAFLLLTGGTDGNRTNT